jgi:diadenosine tetraphosphate (Ap4A) HIT family hydrolase
MNDRRFPWVVLVPQRAGLCEIFELASADRALLIEETAGVAQALQRVTSAAKINVGALGNIVRQLHIHVVARRPDDAAWPGPVWGSGARTHYPAGAAASFAAELRSAIGAN